MKRHRHHEMTRQGLSKFVYIITLLLAFTACRGPREVVETKYETKYIDSVVLRDSVVVIPKEVYTNITWNYDTLDLETSLAVAHAWVDSIWLRGEIRNKQQVQYKYIDRWHDRVRDTVIYETKTEYVDKPVYVNNPTNTGLVIWTVLSGIGLVAFIVWKVYKVLF